jgi:undecaprenyl diphosphate synthase
MDGNGRWANQRGLPRTQGHKAGAETAKTIVRACRELGVKYLTLYTFSKENWSRPKDEVRTLFELLVDFLTREIPSLVEQSIRLNILGEVAELPFAARQIVKLGMNKTKLCDAMTLNLALNYSGRDEILRACRQMLLRGLNPEDVSEELFKEFLFTAGQPDPDLVIRTSGELRISNYLLFQTAYSEFYFTDTLWPDFDEAELSKAIDEYSRRQRRFGKTGEQIEAMPPDQAAAGPKADA